MFDIYPLAVAELIVQKDLSAIFLSIGAQPKRTAVTVITIDNRTFFSYPNRIFAVMHSHFGMSSLCWLVNNSRTSKLTTRDHKYAISLFAVIASFYVLCG